MISKYSIVPGNKEFYSKDMLIKYLNENDFQYEDSSALIKIMKNNKYYGFAFKSNKYLQYELNKYDIKEDDNIYFIKYNNEDLIIYSKDDIFRVFTINPLREIIPIYEDNRKKRYKLKENKVSLKTLKRLLDEEIDKENMEKNSNIC